ncbi:UPF0161 protein At3g09310 isoform X1 [Corylus avellana]|uniref:UPF0161 protein At3g09310 isoform X1 n=1 Tax=Corylus avellana TaxID=13451 RepID=UPI00286A71F1|nr:UPF0161 protein At3g09310 isoform X1 [Corylus avellana]
MAVVLSLGSHKPLPAVAHSQYPNFKPLNPKHISSYFAPINKSPRRRYPIFNKLNKQHPNPEHAQEEDKEVDNLGVQAALSTLRFYKTGEISPLLPNSCRYVPTCSEYSMEAYKKYGVVKGTVLTAWRLCRCNPLGGSGFDPPRWFDERSVPKD